MCAIFVLFMKKPAVCQEILSRTEACMLLIVLNLPIGKKILICLCVVNAVDGR